MLHHICLHHARWLAQVIAFVVSVPWILGFEWVDLQVLRTENQSASLLKHSFLYWTVNPCVPGSSPGRGAN